MKLKNLEVASGNDFFGSRVIDYIESRYLCLLQNRPMKQMTVLRVAIQKMLQKRLKVELIMNSFGNNNQTENVDSYIWLLRSNYKYND